MEWNEILYMGGNESSNPINRFDTRLKLVFLAFAILLILLSSTPWVPIYYTGLSLLLMLFADVRIEQFFMRLVAPFVVVTTLLVIQAFFYGSTPYYHFSFLEYEFVVYWEGLLRGGLLALRVTGGISLLILLSLTSSILSILSALKYFKVPRSWLEIVFLSYRYLFVFLQHLTTSYQAQKIRLGYQSISDSVNSLGTLSGHLFLHIFDQTDRTYKAMQTRGYRGFLPVPDVFGDFTVGSLFVAIGLFMPGFFLVWL